MIRRAVTMWLWPAIALMAIAAIGADAPDKPAAEVPKLDGVWEGFAVEGKGEKPNRGPVHLKLTVKGDHIDAERLDGQALPMNEGTYKITPATPMQMDGTEISTRARNRVFLGICELSGDTLKWCVSTRKERPTEFETKSPNFLVILKRQKPQAP